MNSWTFFFFLKNLPLFFEPTILCLHEIFKYLKEKKRSCYKILCYMHTPLWLCYDWLIHLRCRWDIFIYIKVLRQKTNSKSRENGITYSSTIWYNNLLSKMHILHIKERKSRKHMLSKVHLSLFSSVKFWSSVLRLVWYHSLMSFVRLV